MPSATIILTALAVFVSLALALRAWILSRAPIIRAATSLFLAIALVSATHLLPAQAASVWPLVATRLAQGILVVCLVILLFRMGDRLSRKKPGSDAVAPLLIHLGLAVVTLCLLDDLLGLVIPLAPGLCLLGDLLLAAGFYRAASADVLPSAWRWISDNFEDPLVVTDAGGRILDANSRFLDFGAGRDPLRPGQSAEEALGDWPEAAAHLTGTLPSAEVRRQAAVASAPEGSREEIFLISSFSVPGRFGPASRRLRASVFRDETEAREAGRRLGELAHDLEREVAERSSALENVASKRRSMLETLAALKEEVGKTQREIMLTLSEQVENRGVESVRHVARVAEYVRIVATTLGLPPREVEVCSDASAMHDIGKIGVPDSILRKPGGLSPAELEISRSHTRIGHDILCRSTRRLIREAAAIALEHHERWDGAGYPEGKKGERIVLSARIVSICDVFDSMSQDSAYRPALPIDEVVAFIRQERGKRFDPAVVTAFLSSLEAIKLAMLSVSEIDSLPLLDDAESDVEAALEVEEL